MIVDPYGTGLYTFQQMDERYSSSRPANWRRGRLKHSRLYRVHIHAGQDDLKPRWVSEPLKCAAPRFDNPAALANAEQQLHEMIRRDRDKASVVLWSVANETPVTTARVAAAL